MRHWHAESEDGIEIWTLDMAERSANVLSAEVIGELEQLVALTEQRAASGELMRGVVLRSGKSRDFILGADINEFQHVADADEASAYARRAQQVFDRIESLRVPVVALIHGNCLGGGAELALACRYRIAIDEPNTRIGSPEVNLGINPGFGGTVRLPRLVGPLPALDMMLSGRALGARAAKRIGLVDEVVPARQADRAAAMMLDRKPRRRRPPLLQRMLALPVVRLWLAKFLRRQVAKRARPQHYPAPYRIIDLWARGAGYEDEARSLGELMAGEASRNLVHLFLAGDALKKSARGAAHEIRHVHVIGAGVMGGDIAAWAAYKGFHVSLQDLKLPTIANAIGRAHKLYKKKLKTPRAIQEAMDRLMPDPAGLGLRRADIVIEAVAEKLEIKQKVFADAEARTRPGAILATNTSSIPLEQIATALKQPSRLVGMHFFNPVAKMQLVEIVRGAATGEAELTRAAAFAAAIGRLPVNVQSSPGFLVNRVLMPYLMEAMTLAEEGTPLADIDRAATDFGMPMGPIHLADTVGLDICLSVAEELSGPLGMKVPAGLRTMVDAGKLGKKSGEGFYRYDGKGRPNRGTGKVDVASGITDRLMLRMLNELVACLREKVIADDDTADVAMVYGTGFAPFRGGPMCHARTAGIDAIRNRLEELNGTLGTRFRPDAGWADIGEPHHHQEN